MKFQKLAKKVAVALVFVMVLLNSCLTTPERRMVESLDDVVGTWTDREGHTWVFNADGKLIYQNSDTQYFEYQCNVFNGRLTIGVNPPGLLDEPQIYNASISVDGKSLFLNGKDLSNNRVIWTVAGPGFSRNVLRR